MSPRPETIVTKRKEYLESKTAFTAIEKRLAELSREYIDDLQINCLVIDMDGNDLCIHPAHKDDVDNRLSTWVPGGSLVVSQIEPDGSVNIRWGKGFESQNYPLFEEAEQIWDPGVVKLSLLMNEHRLDLADADMSTTIMNKYLSKWMKVLTWIETGLAQSGYKKKRVDIE